MGPTPHLQALVEGMRVPVAIAAVMGPGDLTVVVGTGIAAGVMSGQVAVKPSGVGKDRVAGRARSHLRQALAAPPRSRRAGRGRVPQPAHRFVLPPRPVCRNSVAFGVSGRRSGHFSEWKSAVRNRSRPWSSTP